MACVTATLHFLKSANITAKEVYARLCNFAKINLKLIYDDLIQNACTFDPAIKLAILACLAKRFSNKAASSISKPKLFISVPFPSKGVEFINLLSILRYPQAKRLIPVNLENFGNVILSYKFKPNNGLKYLSYNKALRSLHHADLLNYLNNKQCTCNSSPFICPTVGHVVTGNCDIIQQRQLRGLFEKGTKYREPTIIDWAEVLSIAKLTVEQFVEVLHKKAKIPLLAFVPYKEKALQFAVKRVEQCKTLYHNNLDKTLTPQSRLELRRLNSAYVVTCADKASGNFVFVCKKYYFQVLAKELGIFEKDGRLVAEGNTTYRLCSEDTQTIISRHKLFAKKLAVSLKNEDLILPKLFAIPKMHKNPLKFRFIARAKHSSMKSISCKLAKILTFCKRHFENYCNAISQNTGRHLRWSISSSSSAINMFQNIGNVTSLITVDFSTLYTSLPHAVILQNLFFLVDTLFKNSGKQFMILGYPCCYYADNRHSELQSLTKFEVFEIIDVVLNNAFITFAGFIFQQVSGIPMGGNASPLIADLTLAVLEFKFLNNSSFIRECKLLKWTTRYIDDLLC